MTQTTTSAAINEIMRNLSNVKRQDKINTSLRVLGGIETLHERQMVYSVMKDEAKWSRNGKLDFSERKLNYEEKRISAIIAELENRYEVLKKFRSILVARNSYATCTSFFYISGLMKSLRKEISAHQYWLEDARNWKPEATIKRNLKGVKLHRSYTNNYEVIDSSKINAFVNRLKLEDELDIKPIDNPYSLKETEQLIKVVGYEYRKPYIIIRAIKAEDEHDRLYDTRTSDETPEIYFSIDVSQKVLKSGKVVENPELTRLRKWMWHKVDHSEPGTSFSAALEQLIDRVYLISLNQDSEEFIGYPTYDLNERFEYSYNRFDSEYLNSFRNSRIG